MGRSAELRVEKELARALNFGRGEAHPVLILENLVGSRRLTIDPNQVLLGPTVWDLLFEERTDGSSLSDLDVVREAAAVVVDKQNFHGIN
jgi:hypothetical protein